MERNKIGAGILFLVMLSFVQSSLQAQELVFERKVDSVPNHPNFGPNNRHFYHAFLSTSIAFQPSNPSTIKTDQPFTGQITLGFRYKFKLARPITLVSDIGINRNFFRIDQNPEKTFPDTLIHQSQSLRSIGFFGGLFLRLRLGQRGDYLGNYIDFGLTAQALVKNQLKTKEKSDPINIAPYLTDKITLSRIDGINPICYKAAVRIGFDRFSVIATYRLSRLVTNLNYKDLPIFEIGLEFSPVRY